MTRAAAEACSSIPTCCIPCRAPESALHDWANIDCTQRCSHTSHVSQTSTAHTQDTDDIADGLIADVFASRTDMPAWMPMPASPASADLQLAAQQLRSASPHSSAGLEDSSSDHAAERDTDGGSDSGVVDVDAPAPVSPMLQFCNDSPSPGSGAHFRDDTLLGTATMPGHAQSPILALHSSAGIVECEGMRSWESMRTSASAFMPAFSPAPVDASDSDFTFPCLSSPAPLKPTSEEPAATPPPSPPDTPAAHTPADPYGAFARFLSAACYNTPMPGAARGAAEATAAGDQPLNAAAVPAAKPKIPLLTPDLWHAHAANNCGEPGSPVLSKGGFSFRVEPLGTPAPTPRFGAAPEPPKSNVAQDPAVASPTIFAAAGLPDGEPARTPVAFGAAVRSPAREAAIGAMDAAVGGAASNPFSRLQRQCHQQAGVSDVAAARTHIQAMHRELGDVASPAAGAPSVPATETSSLVAEASTQSSELPPPGTPLFTRFMRHLNADKRSPVPNGKGAIVAARPQQAQPAQSASNTGSSIPSRPRQSAATAPAPDSDEATQAHDAASPAPWRPFAALLSNIRKQNYQSPMHFSFKAKQPASPAVKDTPPAEVVQEASECVADSGAGATPPPVLSCPLSDRNSVSGEKSSEERSSQRRVHSLHFSGASETNDCSPVSGLSRPAFAHDSVDAGADENSPPPVDSSCNSPPFPGVLARTLHQSHGQSPLMQCRAAPLDPQAAFSSPTSVASNSAHSEAALRVRLEPVCTPNGAQHVLLHISSAEQAWLPGRTDSPACAPRRQPSRTSPDLNESVAANAAATTRSITDAMRMSGMSDMVITGDITPRDINEDADAAALPAADAIVAAAPMSDSPVINTSPDAAQITIVQPALMDANGMDSPASPPLQDARELPELRQSASPDLQGMHCPISTWLDCGTRSS